MYLQLLANTVPDCAADGPEGAERSNFAKQRLSRRRLRRLPGGTVRAPGADTTLEK
jgi:hypothetical protein